MFPSREIGKLLKGTLFLFYNLGQYCLSPQYFCNLTSWFSILKLLLRVVIGLAISDGQFYCSFKSFALHEFILLFKGLLHSSFLCIFLIVSIGSSSFETLLLKSFNNLVWLFYNWKCSAREQLSWAALDWDFNVSFCLVFIV